jgi:hypothetical protein
LALLTYLRDAADIAGGNHVRHSLLDISDIAVAQSLRDLGLECCRFQPTRSTDAPRAKEIVPQEGMTLADTSKQQRANAQFKKQQRVEDGKKAMTEYEADAAAVRVRMAKQRELRLARDAAAPAASPPAKKRSEKKAVTGTKGRD